MMVTRISLIFGTYNVLYVAQHSWKIQTKGSQPPGGGGTRHMKGVGMLVVSLTGGGLT